MFYSITLKTATSLFIAWLGKPPPRDGGSCRQKFTFPKVVFQMHFLIIHILFKKCPNNGLVSEENKFRFLDIFSAHCCDLVVGYLMGTLNLGLIWACGSCSKRIPVMAFFTTTSFQTPKSLAPNEIIFSAQNDCLVPLAI